jgi:hypothetical protein
MDWVGREKILLLDEVHEAPARVNAAVATPSVYVDERGEIHNFKIGGRRLNLLHTKSGAMRSGDIHKDYQHDFVFSGAVEVWCLEKDGSTRKQIYRENQYVFHFLEDTVLAEWWDGPFHAWFYKPYRKIVEASFTGRQGGQFLHYKIAEPANPHTKDIVWPLGLPVAGASTIFFALVTSFAVGYFVGRRRL